ncbi:MAG: hypothetical protein RIT81_31710 [Deltaproteobacteria bacterium]
MRIGCLSGLVFLAACSPDRDGAAPVFVGATLDAITITLTPEVLTVGSSATLAATGAYSDGSTRNVTDLAVWTVDDPAIARIEGDQLVALAPGTTRIEAAALGRRGELTFTIADAGLETRLAVDATALDLDVGESRQLVLTATHPDETTSDVTAAATWRSSDGASVQVTAGLVTASSSGNAIVSATHAGVTVETTVVVRDDTTLSALAIQPSSATAVAGDVVTLTAMATYADGATRDVTTDVAWTSSLPSVATVSVDGVVRTLASGVVTIGAELDGVRDSVDIVVGACTFAASSTEVAPQRAVPGFAWVDVTDAQGARTDFSMESFACDPQWRAYNSALVVVATEWDPITPKYLAYISGVSDAFTDAGTIIVYVVAQDTMGQPASQARATAFIDATIPGAPGLRAGDADTLSSPNVGDVAPFYPFAFIVRRSDMQVVAVRQTSPETDFVSVAESLR